MQNSILKNKASITGLLLLFSSAILFSCSSTKEEVKDTKDLKTFYPAGPKEKILDENGNEVEITSKDPELFQKDSKNPDELFRVVISSESYKVRQIRKTDLIKRKPDPGGDSIIMEELIKYNKKDFVDDGIISVKLNTKTGKMETINTDRSTRIQQLLKIISGDATRWILEHKNTEEPTVTKYLITYNVV
ncbi:MAG TPA: hypothetical protein PLS71_25420, partial [Leptospiraceae bacterium]|nr:hypothetical protein [Leptospiraceae bacterium]